MAVAEIRPRGTAHQKAVEAAICGACGANSATGSSPRRRCASSTAIPTWLPNQPPDAVVFPQSTEDVQDAVRICAQHNVPVIPFGTGTSLEGHVNAPHGGVSLDFRDMNRMLAVHAEDLDCVVEPGVTRKQLNEYLRDQGLFFPIDPGADASIGGMAATRASGTNAVRYGTMKDNVLSLKVVLANGEMIQTSRRAKKSSAGYDLTRLFVGSEGTLGVITEITLKLHGIPEAISGGICPFPSVEAACNAAIATIQSGHSGRAHRTVRRAAGEGQQRLFQADLAGDAAAVSRVSRHRGRRRGAIRTLRRDLGGPWRRSLRLGPTNTEERTKLWQARHDAYWAVIGLQPGTKAFATDVCVPISRLAECVIETQRDIAEHDMIAPIVGHVGDGNFHVSLLLDMDDPAEVANGKAFSERLVERALAMEGTCTGEHGVGQGKMKYLAAEHGAALGVMQSIKRAMDPQDLMNPGKIVAF